jgi:hypothetical protein
MQQKSKMKKKSKSIVILFITIFAGIFILIITLPTIPTQFRDLRIEIIDARTKKPLSNINVYYILEACGPGNLLGIPVLDPIHFRYVKFGHYESNINGIVEIKNEVLFLKLYEKIFWEGVAINLDVESNNNDYKKRTRNFFFNHNDEKLICLNKNYGGVKINSLTYIKNIKKKVVKEKKYDLVSLDGKNLESKDDVFIGVEMRVKKRKQLGSNLHP